MNINENDVDFMMMETNFVNGRANMSGNLLRLRLMEPIGE